MAKDVSVVCRCGKKKNNLNSTNWARHITTCKIMKSVNATGNISSFLKRSSVNDELNNLIKKRPGK